jgi:phospholipid/cholesterol/gamma-HCH transport system permease protein
MAHDAATQPDATLQAQRGEDGSLRLALAGPLTAVTVAALWREALNQLRAAAPRRLVVDAAAVPLADGAGVGLLMDLQRQAAARDIPFELVGANEQVRGLLALYQPEEFLKEPPPPPAELSIIEEIGRNAWLMGRDVYDQVVFIGELCAAMIRTLAQPRRLRWRDVMVIAERAGVDALPIVMLLGFLIGLIMAFQATIPLQMFGAELYVSDFVALVMVREMGALITAVILIGRTGSAFAAELGTMKINEELNALETLGLEPVRFLVVGRVLAVTSLTPLLTVFAMLAGLLGGLVVVLSLGFPAITYYHEAVGILSLKQVFAGLSKTVVFGLEVAAIGCMRGMQTKSGASAVGQAATRSVVTATIVIVVTDGLFAVAFYYLGI